MLKFSLLTAIYKRKFIGFLRKRADKYADDTQTIADGKKKIKKNINYYFYYPYGCNSINNYTVRGLLDLSCILNKAHLKHNYIILCRATRNHFNFFFLNHI